MRHTIETEPAAVVEYQEILARNRSGIGDEPSERLGPRTVEQLMREIRWANLGWVYQVRYHVTVHEGGYRGVRLTLCMQWSTKSYDLTPGTATPFPKDLAELCSDVVRNIPWVKVYESQGDKEAGDRTDWRSWTEDYGLFWLYLSLASVDWSPSEPDTGIVNFYQLNDTLMGHVDRAE